MSIFIHTIKKKVSQSHLFLFVIIIFLGFQSIAQEITSHPKIYSAYNDILRLKIKTGRDKLNLIIPNHAQQGHYQYVKSLADIIEILITEDQSLYEKLEDNEETYLKGIRDMDDSDPYKRYYKAEIRIQWAMVKIMFEDDMKAGWALKSAYSYVERNIEEHPDFEANYKSFGVLHVIFATVPESYHWVLKFLGIRGNTVQGWEELNSIKSDNPFWLETGMVKALIAINIINKEKPTMELMDQLLSKQKDNLILQYLYNTALVKYARSEEALPNLRKLLFISHDYSSIGSIYYKLGDIYMQKQQYSLARYHYSMFLNQHRGSNYVKDSWFKIFLSYWLDGNIKMAEIHWEKAKESGRNFTAADKNASSILSKDEYPNIDLMKARLSTDGGYFDLAATALDNIKQGSLSSKMEEAEYFYRLARLYNKQGKDESAIFNYLNAIKKAGKENSYIAPSACLYTGYIYESRKNIEKATFYFEKAMSYKKHAYKDGIDHKAHAALELLSVE